MPRTTTVYGGDLRTPAESSVKTGAGMYSFSTLLSVSGTWGVTEALLLPKRVADALAPGGVTSKSKLFTRATGARGEPGGSVHTSVADKGRVGLGESAEEGACVSMQYTVARPLICVGSTPTKGG